MGIPEQAQGSGSREDVASPMPPASPGIQGTVKMASPLQSCSAKPGGSTHVSTKRSLFASDELHYGQSPPEWFTDFVKGFEARLENYIH